MHFLGPGCQATYLIYFIDDCGEFKRLVILAKVWMALAHDSIIGFFELAFISIGGLQQFKHSDVGCELTCKPGLVQFLPRLEYCRSPPLRIRRPRFL